ncbi:hypothetical protein [Streptomyces specialis]|uniref:hypothetical protein n=1 Tax=Streptomyces specialis TaxID=498367 RepID=UPI002D21906E|nr:hypothetical protein [Streptomyces specialis]
MTGVAVGYVLGARAGRERYERLRVTAEKLMSNPAVRNTVDSATQSGRQAATWAAGAVADRAGDKLPGPVTSKLRAVGGQEEDAGPEAQTEGRAAL